MNFFLLFCFNTAEYRDRKMIRISIKLIKKLNSTECILVRQKDIGEGYWISRKK